MKTTYRQDIITKDILIEEEVMKNLKNSNSMLYDKILEIYNFMNDNYKGLKTDISTYVDEILVQLFSSSLYTEATTSIPLSFVNSKLGTFLFTVKMQVVKSTLTASEVLEIINNARGSEKPFTIMMVYQAAKRGELKGFQSDKKAWFFYLDDVNEYMKRKNYI